MSTMAKVTATGNVGTGSRSLLSIVLAGGSAAATLDVRLNGSGDAVAMTLAAPIGDSVVWRAGSRQGVGAAQPHATLAGTGASATFEYD